MGLILGALKKGIHEVGNFLELDTSGVEEVFDEIDDINQEIGSDIREFVGDVIDEGRFYLPDSVDRMLPSTEKITAFLPKIGTIVVSTAIGGPVAGIAAAATIFTIECIVNVVINKSNLKDVLKGAINNSSDENARKKLAAALNAHIKNVDQEACTVSMEVFVSGGEKVDVKIKSTQGVSNNIYSGMAVPI